MKLSLSLIKSFIDIDLSPEKCAEVLTLLGIEVDGIEKDTLEISLTPNLGHCMSAVGIARELAAALNKPLMPGKNVYKSPTGKISVSVQNETLAPRYMVHLIEGIKVGPSPAWLQKELQACGMNPISNVVDVTNYMLLKWGQPLHAFDWDKIEGHKISVKCAQGGESFLGLNGAQVEVPHGALLIEDAKKPIALAGILGGENSAVSAETRNILLEAAAFDPIAIRIAAKKMNLRTDSAQRFEKGVDPANIPLVLGEACALIAELTGGKVTSQGADLHKSQFHPKIVSCRSLRANQILGTQLSLNEIKDIFQRLAFPTSAIDEKTLRVEVPLYRNDISEEIDLVEEVARIYGYNNIEKRPPLCRTSTLPQDPMYLFERETKQRLCALGLQEFLTCDLISPALGTIARELLASHVTFLHTLHSKSEEYSVLRPSLLPGLLQVVKNNNAHKNHTLHAFETGRVHFSQEGKVVEIPTAALLLTGKAAPSHWSHKDQEADFFALKGLLENFCTGLGFSRICFTPSQHMTFHPGRQANLEIDGLIVGSFGEVHPNFLEPFDIKQKVLFAELQLPALLRMRTSVPRMTPLPQFPASERDWTIPLPLDVQIGSLVTRASATQEPLLEKVELIDLYQPEGATVKNATLRFTYRGREKTASYEEVEAAHMRIVEQVSKGRV